MFLGGNMVSSVQAATRSAQFVFQGLCFGLVLISAICLTCLTIGAALGLLPWLTLPLQIGQTLYDQAGHVIQIAGTVFFVMLSGFLPTQARIMALETSHRRFSMGMEDVAHAYQMAHAADRGEVFRLSSEFDSIRERLAYMRRHPDLANLEPDILEIAAQMSHLSRALAETYSDANVGRAKMFLRQRQQEVAVFKERLVKAQAISKDLSHWLQQVEREEAEASQQLAQLRAELAAIMPEVLPIETRASVRRSPAPVHLASEAPAALRRAAE
jgi:hypothetical protein